VYEIIRILFRHLFVLCLALAFAAGCLAAGLFFHWWGSVHIGELDTKYAGEQRRAAETIGKLTAELGRERGINRELREHNSKKCPQIEPMRPGFSQGSAPANAARLRWEFHYVKLQT
jgi:hypothetical protein